MLEPTGQIAPRIPGDGLNKLNRKILEELAFICDAQAYPVPLMRWDFCSFMI